MGAPCWAFEHSRPAIPVRVETCAVEQGQLLAQVWRGGRLGERGENPVVGDVDGLYLVMDNRRKVRDALSANTIAN
jgi:hypothetical protein